MRIFRHHSTLPKDLYPATIAIGNFDGVHLGHRSLVKKTLKIAKENKMPSAVLTFEPHPKDFFNLNEKPFRLTPFRTKVFELQKLGLDAIIVLQFNKAFANQKAKTFVQNVLINGLRAGHIVAGHDFKFGCNRQGNCTLLSDMGKKFGFGFTAVKPVKSPEETVYSSTVIRECIANGDTTKTKLFLGRYFSIQGRVAHGRKLGRSLGFPTINIHLTNVIRPKFGVYAVTIQILEEKESRFFEGVANIGTRPTIDGKDELLEVFIFDFNENIYQKQVKVDLINYIRPEKKFKTLKNMKAQMKRDTQIAKQFFKKSS